MTQIDKKNPALIAFYVTERNDKAFWTRIGAAWLHEDGKGYSLRLDLMPTPSAGGRVVLREQAPEDGAGA